MLTVNMKQKIGLLSQQVSVNFKKKETCIEKLEIHKLTEATPAHVADGTNHASNWSGFSSDICKALLFKEECVCLFSDD